MPPQPIIALLASRGARLDHGPSRGSDVVFWDDYSAFRSLGWQVKLFGHRAGQGLPVDTLPMTFRVPLLSSMDYCGTFVYRNRGALLLAYNEPTVAFLAPRRAVVRFDWPTPLPRYWRQPWALRRFQRGVYLFPSRFLRDSWLEEHQAIWPDCTAVIANGVDLELFRPVQHKPPGRLRIGFAGQWAPGKGILVLLKAWEAIRHVVAGAELWLAGGAALSRGPSPDPESLELERFVQEVKGVQGIHSVGILPRDRMPWFWGQVDLAVVPSMFEEPFGLVALEAMACGVPVVVSDDGALPEVVGSGGMVVPRGDPQKLAEALLRLLQDPNERERLASLARKRAEIFSIEERSARLFQLMQDRAIRKQ